MVSLSGFAWILLGWATLVCLVQCSICLHMLARGFSPKNLDRLTPATPERWPRVSVLVAARNEGTTIEAALETLLAQDYPGLEIILVDDRSSDETGGIVDRMAARDARIKALHVDELPDGWLGKVHALYRGVEIATGEWLLFTDADVHFGPGAIRIALAHALEEKKDFVAVLPRMLSHGALQDAVLNAFGIGFVMLTRPHKLETDDQRSYIGIGAFNLVRREVYDRSEGLEWLKMEIADDAGLALAAKRAGAKLTVLFGGALLDIDWYPNIRALILGLEKNAFGAAAQFSLPRLLVSVFLIVSAIAAPLIALLSFNWLIALGALAVVSNIIVSARTARLLRMTPWVVPLTPVGMLVIMYAAIRSAVICYRNSGVRWRDTYYSLETLRAGKRVFL
jgi:glycosyltransferase involved in cell wall biosynthesis